MVFKNPDNFIKLFLASIIIGPGIKVAGYPLVDEYWVLMLLFGLFMRKMLLTNIVVERTERKRLSSHEIAFIFLTLYFLFQSFRGGFWLEDLRMLRWIIFFMIVGISFFVVSNYSQSINPEYVTKIVIYSVTIFFLLYFLSGYFYELITGMSKFDLQGIFVSGSSTATFPVVIYLIALLLFYQEKKGAGINLFIILSFIIVSWTVVYYDSRSGIFSILIILALNFLFQLPRVKKKGKTQVLLIILFFVIYQFWSVNFSGTNRSVLSFMPVDVEFNIIVPEVIHYEEAPGRILVIRTAFNFVTEKISTTFFGYGWYMTRYEIIESIRKMRKEQSMTKLNLSKEKPYQPSGVVALLVDTGFVGVFLFLINLLYGFFAILKTSNSNKYVISIAYLSVVLWSFVGAITPLLLFYFWVMPNNPILLMLEENKKPTLV